MSTPIFYNQDSFIRFKKRKARFSFSEVHILLDEVRKHRMVVVGKFNRGVPTDIKKRTWAEITARVNEIGECQREIIEVIKKWSDLKCDTKRKVGAMRFWRWTRKTRSPGTLALWEMNDDVPEEEEEMEEDIIGMQSSPNGGLDGASMPPPMSYTMKDSSQTAYDVQYEIPATEDVDAALGDSDDDQREDVLHSTKPTEIHLGNNGIQKQGPPPTSSGPAAAAAAAAAATTAASSSSSSNSNSSSSNSSSSNNPYASTASLEEQHATNILLETVSRSLELLSESVQQLSETQQEFVRESLQLQRETVQVLRDFTDGAISLMHDKLNGRPAL
ncbi:hypothetical protein KUCAC02_003304 [Chaenocephalus aceratus]|uniref:Uncharacterized protein n=1 Tax=Chaenocephalus aceratus TaxID=36190 RepID=A0ACB9WKW6_CHAAC|nr:hypothetical protein KUCAC02_003304 [Chaenocephalus aceratus]